tara:strand:+ start:342 stop:1016 length:675 start_codon:yes stop_codon:yes gene_type:complete
MIYLTVTAHPDDEILGFGGSSYVLTKKGHIVYNLILSGKVEARENKPDNKVLKENVFKAQQIVGAEPPILGSFPNIKFNTIPHLELVQFIEHYIENLSPDYIFTHHPFDINIDHQETSKACQAASRLFQRKTVKPIKGLYFMEVPSATDWTFKFGSNSFCPNSYIEIGKTGLDKKIEALDTYEGVMRKFPHPRSNEVLTGLAQLRGGESGYIYAESFQLVFNRL